mmetsp:Transcript_42281/g.104792  ORF Transcript_42281/g.104792 Transcript_42281/m.104792 type:complete len:435 (+) Transcript_42281:2-1306(+)
MAKNGRAPYSSGGAAGADDHGSFSLWAWGLLAAVLAASLTNRLGGLDVLFPSGPEQLSTREPGTPTVEPEPRTLPSATVELSAPEQPPRLDGCRDNSEFCVAWASSGECATNAGYMATACPVSCGTCPADIAAIPVKSAAQQVEPISAAPAGDDAEKCEDTSASCVEWARLGECAANAGYMTTACPVSCDTCEELKVACNRHGEPGISGEPGGLEALFERATSEEFTELGPQVLSRTPWVVSFDNFMRPEEGAAFLEHCNSSFERSLAGDQLSPVRTSHQCWCSAPACLNDTRVRALTERVAALVGIPSSHMEYAQVVRYEPGQFYRTHHDQNSAPWSPQGVRLLTMFMYINDVEEGGGTRFTDLDLTVKPRAGKAVLWPSVLDRNLSQEEPRTHHEALPPVSGLKFAVNLWIHQHDFKTPSRNGCKWTTRNTK